MEGEKKTSNKTAIIILGVVLVVLAIGGIAYYLTLPKEGEKTVQKNVEEKGGLSSLLSSLNLSGLTIFGAGS